MQLRTRKPVDLEHVLEIDLRLLEDGSERRGALVSDRVAPETAKGGRGG